MGRITDRCRRQVPGMPPTLSADGAAIASVWGGLQVMAESVLGSKGLRHRSQVGTMN